MSIERREPAYRNDEVGMLREFLDFYRATVRRQAAGLTDEQLQQTLGPSDLTLGGLLKHLAFVEGYWFRQQVTGLGPRSPWDVVDWKADPDWDWHSAAEDTHAELDSLLVEAIAASDRHLDEALARGDLDQETARKREQGTATLRWVLVHLVEEYARHAGHADLIRESIDGAKDL